MSSDRNFNCRSSYHLSQAEHFYKNYPFQLQSLLHTNLARALFKIDFECRNGYKNREKCAHHFEEAIRLNAQNWYAHNWYATFLKEVELDFNAAAQQYSSAIQGDNKKPQFRYNLALLYYDYPEFSRNRLEKAVSLVEEAIAICDEQKEWVEFIDFPKDLMFKLRNLLSRSDVADETVIEREGNELNDM